MLHNRNGLASFVIAVLAVLLPAGARAQPPTIAADAFVDSVGVNLHLHYYDTVYADFPIVRSRLIELGLRHVRDGLIDTSWQDYYNRFDSLAQAGIKATFIVAPNQSTELWASYPARMSRSFEAFEAPNEFNLSGDPNWVQTLRQTLVRMRSLRSDARSAAFPVIGPALTTADAYQSLGDVSAYIDAGNMHNYMGGRNPGTPGWSLNGHGSIAWSKGNVMPHIAGKPIITTENGYHGNFGKPNAVPPDVAGRYMPRLLLEQFRAGIPRTYIYELLDWKGSDSYGLLNEDFSPKPAFNAVKGLLNLLSDRGPAFTPQNLEYTVDGGSTDVRHMVFQKRDGTYFLAIWREVSAFDHALGQRVSVAPEAVTVTLASPMRVQRLHRWQGDGTLSSASASATTDSLPITISDHLTVIELGSLVAPASGPPGAPSGLAATVNDRAVLLRWLLPTDGSAPSGLVIEASQTLDFANIVRVPTGVLTELVVPNVAPGVYFVRLRAANGSGESDPSNVVQLAVGVPQPPHLVASQVSANPITLSWSGSAGSQYVLSAGTSPGASDVAVVPMGAATQVTAAVPLGVRYYIRVAALNSHGAMRSNEIDFAIAAAQQPGAPALQAHVSGRHVTVSWTPGAGGPPNNYLLMVGTSAGAGNIGVFPVGQATTISAESPIAGTFYVRVIAQNSGGSAGSNEVSFSIP